MLDFIANKVGEEIDYNVKFMQGKPKDFIRYYRVLKHEYIDLWHAMVKVNRIAKINF